MQIIELITNVFFVLALGFYAITALQWFSYKINRVIFHFTKPLWHFVFFITPLALYYALLFVNLAIFVPIFWLIFLPLLIFWHIKLDKKLVFTARVKRFFGILVALFLGINFVFYKFALYPNAVLTPIILAFVFSEISEKAIFWYYKCKAQKKLENMPNLLIIQITASYGKTSIKNFLCEILSAKFNVHKTPRSVNTLMGIIRDINENLSFNSEIYIAEAGARMSGDIAQITQFLRPQIVIVGEIGAQHIEYFKTLENIRKTKLEALNSPRLKIAFLHSTTGRENSENLVIYDKFIQNINADLNGLSFEMKFDEIAKFSTNLLGAFNAQNIGVCVSVAKFLGVEMIEISRRVKGLKSVSHRLERINSGEKLIIDDGFNGNFKGMVASYELVKTYNGTKILVTPGIVESDEEQNENLAKKADEIFDKIIVTGEINRQIFTQNVKNAKLIICDDKSKLIEILALETKSGDLILFSNDAPSYV